MIDRTRRVLVTWGSKMGGTEGIARMIGEVLAAEGCEIDARPAAEVRSLVSYDAAIVGGAIYANRWHPDAVRLIERHAAALRRLPVWLFSSGPLDASADLGGLAATDQVAALAERIGAQSHTTFGGRLPADARGFPAAAMAKQRAGDWRNPARIREWAAEVVHELPVARPRAAHEPPGRAASRLVAHGLVGWALCAAAMLLLLRVAPHGLALAAHAVVAPLIFVAVARRYFRVRGARDPLPTAAAWTLGAAALDGAVALIRGDAAMIRSVVGLWLPLALIFAATWLTGAIVAMVPPRSPGAAAHHAAERAARRASRHGGPHASAGHA